MSISRVLPRLLCVLLTASALALSAAALAQMPDPRQMSGIPRPVNDLPNGSLSVRLIRGALTNNIAGHPVELHIGDKVQVVNTDADGRAQFDKLPAGAMLKAVAVVDGERLESQEFPAPSDGAIRLMLVATDKEMAAEASAPAVSGQVVIAGGSRIVIEPAEEGLSIFYILDVMNNGQAPVNPTVPFVFDMPAAAVNTTVVQGSSPLASSKGRKVTIRGPFPPGKTTVEIAASLPVSSPSVEITQTFPALFEQPVFVVKKEGAMSVSSVTFDRQQETAVEGTPVIIGASKPVAAGEPISLTVTGMAYRSGAPRFVALSLALGIIVIGAWYSVKATDSPDRRADQQRLVARREKLLGELTRLEQEHRLGKVDPTRFSTRREELVRSLEAVYATLDRDDALEGAFHAAGGMVGRTGTA